MIEKRYAGMTGLDLAGAVWRKSSRSNNNGGDCVEVAFGDSLIAVRDSKDSAGPILAFGPARWAAFIGQARNGALDFE